MTRLPRITGWEVSEDPPKAGSRGRWRQWRVLVNKAYRYELKPNKNQLVLLMIVRNYQINTP